VNPARSYLTFRAGPIRFLARVWLLVAIPQPLAAQSANGQVTVEVGSKTFSESVVLGELVVHLGRAAGARMNHREALGGTLVVWNALLAGDVDIYPEYTGTLKEVILRDQRPESDADIRAALATYGLRMTNSLGFSNNYELAVRPELAQRLNLRTYSDLNRHPDLRFGFSNEFIERGEGWPGLRSRYGFRHSDVRGMDHAFAYKALEAGDIDVVDLYSTDAEIEYYDLVVLEDDLRHFPRYEAVFIYRADLDERAPEVVAAIERLQGAISQEEMTQMNVRVKPQDARRRVSASRAANDFLRQRLGMDLELAESTAAERIARHTLEHLLLVAWSLAAAILVAVPLGILAAKLPAVGQVILAVTGVIQTIPSLVILVLLIGPVSYLGLRGAGSPTAIIALFLYSLLPIVRNTYSGLQGIPPPLGESAAALGLSPLARLRLVELPMAARTILAGIKTAAVINVGFATLGGFIGAGGYGQLIFRGLRTDNTGLILEGAVPAALMALAVQGLFELAERTLVSPGLRLQAGR